MKKTDKIYICIIILLMLLCLRSCKKATSTNTIKESNSIGINTYKKPILSVKTINEVHVKDDPVHRVIQALPPLVSSRFWLVPP